MYGSGSDILAMIASTTILCVKPWRRKSKYKSAANSGLKQQQNQDPIDTKASERYMTRSTSNRKDMKGMLAERERERTKETMCMCVCVRVR